LTYADKKKPAQTKGTKSISPNELKTGGMEKFGRGERIFDPTSEEKAQLHAHPRTRAPVEKMKEEGWDNCTLAASRPLTGKKKIAAKQATKAYEKRDCASRLREQMGGNTVRQIRKEGSSR